MGISGVDLALATEVLIALGILAVLALVLLAKRTKQLNIAKERHRRVVANLENLQKQWEAVNTELLTAREKIEYLETQLIEQSLHNQANPEEVAALEKELDQLKQIETRFQSSQNDLLQSKQELERLEVEFSKLNESNVEYIQEAESLRQNLQYLESEKQMLVEELEHLQILQVRSKTNPEELTESEWNKLMPMGNLNTHDDYKLAVADLRQTCAKQAYTIKELNSQLKRANASAGDGGTALVLAQTKIASLESQLMQSDSCIKMLEEELEELRSGESVLIDHGEEEVAVEAEQVFDDSVDMPDDAIADELEENEIEVPEIPEEQRVSIKPLPVSDFRMAVGTCGDIDSLVDAVLDSIGDMGLTASVRIQGRGEVVARSTTGDVWPEDLEKMAGTLQAGMDDSETEILVRHGKLALLVKDMPFYDPQQCESIKNSIVDAVEIASEVADLIDTVHAASS